MATIRLIHFKHRGGTKDYDLIHLYDGTHSTVIKRWGKIGQKGQITTENFNSIESAAAFIAKQHSTRNANGYDMEVDDTLSVENAESALSFLSASSRALNSSADIKGTVAAFFFSGTTDEPGVMSTPVATRNYTAEIDPSWGSW